jgi:hypothetical protein
VPKKKTTKKEATASLPNSERWALRLQPAVLEAADKVVSELGVGNRTEVMRTAMIYGLSKFLANPALVARATKITLPA